MLVRLGVFILWLIHFLPFRVIVAIGNGLGCFALFAGCKTPQDRQHQFEIVLSRR